MVGFQLIISTIFSMSAATVITVPSANTMAKMCMAELKDGLKSRMEMKML